MNLNEIMDVNCISFDVDLKSKEDVFNYLIKQFYDNKIIDSKERFLKAVLYRESLAETGLSEGIAIPHGKDICVKKAFIGYVRLQNPIFWESIDDSDAKHVFLLAIPDESIDDMHIKMISQLARSLIKKEVIQKINEAKVANELLEVI